MIEKNVKKRFLTIFPFLRTQLLCKDVGAIPYYLTSCGWRSSIAYFPERISVMEPSKTDCQDQVEFISLGLRGGRISNAFRILKFLVMRGSDFDVVNFYHDSLIHMMYAFTYKFISNRRGKVYLKPEISHLALQSLLESRQSWTSTFFRWVKYQLSKITVDFYCVETTDCFQCLVDDYYYRGRLHYIPNGIICSEVTDIDRIISCKENIILTVGNLGSAQKYNELLIDAIALLDAALIKSWRVYLVGPLVNQDFCEVGYKNEGTLVDYVSDVITSHPHLEDTFVFTGTISDRNKLFEIYRKAKIFCLTSRYESFGFVVPESMYFGDFLIASDLPSVRELSDNGRLGSLFQVGDVHQLCLYLTEAMSSKTDLTRSCLDAHEFIRSRLDWRLIVKEIDRIVSC